MLARSDYCDSFTKLGNFIGREAHMLDDLEAGFGKAGLVTDVERLGPGRVSSVGMRNYRRGAITPSMDSEVVGSLSALAVQNRAD